MYKILYNISMKVGVYCNRSSNKFIPIREELFRCLKEKKIVPKVCDDLSDLDVDVLIVLGGDGTILKAAIEAGRSGIRLLGINAGTLGFLSEFEGEQVGEAVELLCSGFETEKRSVLQVSVGGKDYYALNDAVFQRSYNPSADDNVVNIHVRIDGKTVDHFVGDGVIVSTPTGSTAYSLSAGGPVLAPELNALVVNAVCPHTLYSRPLVVGSDAEITLRLIRGGEAELVVDGRSVGRLSPDPVVTVKKGSISALFADAGKNDFYERLLDKMNRWGSARSAEVTGL